MMNNYIVKLNNIKIKSSHGLYEAEKENDQLFEVDIAIAFSKQTCSDDIEKTINYEYVYGVVLDVFKNNTFNLIETLGEKIIDKIFTDYDVENAEINIRKPEITFNKDSNCTEVSISRSNE